MSGLADAFQARGLPLIGPSAAAARIEGSKVFAKDLMRRWGIPTAAYAAFDAPGDAVAHVRRLGGRCVIKADGLSAGKGVVVAADLAEAEDAVQALMVDRVFGDAGRRVVIEECLDGEEVSVFALLDGEAVALLPAAQDHKRALDGDRGPNTGGMGAVAPYPLEGALRRRVLGEILEPTARALVAEGTPYRGVLFAGLMLTEGGPRVLEYNCRLGDPEAQVILPLLRRSLPDALEALRTRRLSPYDLLDVHGAAVGVVLASGGYPEGYHSGYVIEGLAEAEASGALLYHGATAMQDGRLVTAGGRVVTVVGLGSDVTAARAAAYGAAARVRFEGVQYRRDIGMRLAAVPAMAAGRK